MKTCPNCGEKFADSYKRCPFCEEKENPRKARQPRRYEEGGRRLGRRVVEEADEEYENADDRLDSERDADEDFYEEDERSSPWFKITVVILLAIIVACLLYLGRGVIGTLVQNDDDDRPSSSMSSGEEPNLGDDVVQSGDDDTVVDNAGTEPDLSDDEEGNDDTDGQDGESENENGDRNMDNTPSSPVSEKLKLSHEDVTIAGGERFTLTAESGSGSTTYSVKDESIASVSANGVIIGLKKGWTEVTVRRGNSSAVCIVRVRSNAANSNAGTTGDTTTDAKDAKLSSEDFTLKVGESYTLKLSGVTTALTWSVANSGVATVDGSGKVTGVAPGNTTVTVSWDGQSKTCIVRVKS